MRTKHRFAVPPQFVFTTKGKNALYNWLSPVYAVTGNPVTVYSARTFLRQKLQATSALLPWGDFHPEVSPSLSGNKSLTTPV